MRLKWEGSEKLTRALAQIGADMEKKTARAAANAAAQVVRKQAIVNAKTTTTERTGALLRNIVVKRNRPKPGEERYHIGVRNGAALYRGKTPRATKGFKRGARGGLVLRRENDPFYWRFLELGTKTGVKKREFIKKALRMRSQDAVNKMAEVLAKRIGKYNNSKGNL